MTNHPFTAEEDPRSAASYQNGGRGALSSHLHSSLLHYRDKDDRLLSPFEEFLETMNTALSLRREESRRIVPVAELFAYKANLKKLYRTRAHSGRLNDFFDLAQGYFARGIEQRLTESKCLSNLPPCELVPLRWPGACSRCDGGLIAARKNHHWIWTSCSTGSRGTESNRGYVLRAGQAVRWALKSNPTETAC